MESVLAPQRNSFHDFQLPCIGLPPERESGIVKRSHPSSAQKVERASKQAQYQNYRRNGLK